MEYIICTVIGYLLGSVCFAIPVSKLLHSDDVRRHGSGNAGMTNVLRIYGKLPAVLVFAGDFLKGLAAALLAGVIFPGLAAVDYAAGFGAVLGHLFPLYYGFRGGKGIVVAVGVICATNIKVLPVLLAVWVAVLLATRIVSAASIAAAAAFPIATAALGFSAPYEIIFSVVIAALVIIKHKDNIKRLRDGTEHRFGKPREKK